jgi:hypothetical protein
MPLNPEQQARINELRAKQAGGNVLNDEQSFRLNTLRMKSAGHSVPDFAIPEGERYFATGAPGGFGAATPSRMPIPQDEALDWQALSRPVIERELGGPFSFDRELEDFGARFDLSRSTNPEEMMLKLRDKYPNAEVKSLSGFGNEPVPVLRRQGEPDYHAIDSSDKTTSDIADVFGAMLTPDMATSIATAIATRGMGTLPKVLAQGGAGVAGDLINSGIEAVRGYQTDPFQDLLMQAGATGLFNMGGEFLGSKYSRPKGGLMDVPHGVQKVQAAQQAEGLAPLTAGDHHPLVRMKEQQVATTNQPMREAQKDKYRSIGGRLQQETEDYIPSDMEIGDMDLDELIQTQVRTLRKLTSGEDVEMRQGSNALQEGIEDFRASSKTWNDAKYKRARELSEGASFDVTEAQKLADDYSTGIQAKGKPKITQEVSGILDEAGNPITKEVTEEAAGVNVTGDPSGEFNAALKRLRDIDPEIGDFKGENAMDIVKELRSTFGDMGKYGPNNPLPSKQQGQARQIRNLLSDAMDNPSGGSDDFVKSLKSAQHGHKFRRKVLDAAAIKDLRNSKNVYETGRKFATPGQFENLQLVKRSISKKQWKKYQQAAKTDLYRDQDPIKIVDAWDKDPDGFKLLFTPKERAEVRAYAYSLDKIKSGPMMKALKGQKEDGKRVLDFIKSGDGPSVKSLVKSVGGTNSKQGRSIRAGVFENILDEASVLKEGEYLPNPKKLISVIESYEKTGSLKEVMLPADMGVLQNLKVYASGIDRGSDVGASLAGAEIASQFFDVFRPDRMFKGMTAVGRHAILGNMFTHPSVNSKLWGKGVRGEPRLLVRGIVLGLANMASHSVQSGETSLREPGPLDRIKVEDEEK